MPSLWNMTDEEISALSEEEIQSGYLWGSPQQNRQMQEQVRQAGNAARDKNVRYRQPQRIHDASTGKVTKDPGGWERVHDASVPPPQQPQGGLAAMMAEAGGDQELVTAAEEIEGIPGGMELLSTFAAEELMKSQGIPKTKAKKVRLYKIGGPVHRAKGGSARQAAEKTRRAGRGDDSVMLHMTPEEAEVIESMWGAPDINPNTGIGEYGFLSKVWKKVKKGVKKVFKSKAFQIIAPIALSIFMPGLGTAIGSMLGASGAAAGVVGNAVIQGGLGAATGGKKGAIAGVTGSLIGAGAGAYGKATGEALGLSGKTADVVGQSLIKGAGAEATGGDFVSGAIEGGLAAGTKPMTEQFTEDARGAMGLQAKEGDIFASRVAKPPEVTGGLGEATAAPAMSPTGDRLLTPQEELAGVEGDPTGRIDRTATPITSPLDASAEPPLSLPQLAAKYALPAGMAAMGAFSADQSGDEGEPPPWWGRQGDSNFGENLPVYAMNRQFRGLPNQSDYFTYGQPGSPQSGQHLFLAPEPFGNEQGTPTAPLGGLGSVVQATQGGPRSQQRAGVPGRRTGQTTFVAEGGYMDDDDTYWTQNEDVGNTIPTVSREGGHKVKGPGNGRSDDIPAMLSDGEYVIDAESVALLGDGSGNAGARRLDEMRKELRKHKSAKMKKGEFTHKAKKPAAYMRDVRKLKRKAKYEHGGNVAGTSPLPPTQAAGSNI